MAGTGLYDEQGNEFDDSELESGMTAYNDAGELQVLIDDETREQLEAEGHDLDDLVLEVPDDASELDDDLVGVGKAAPAWITGGASSASSAGRKMKAKLLGYGEKVATPEGRRAVLQHVDRNRGTYGLAGGYASGRYDGRKGASKSMGAQLLTELSKAYTDGDRDKVISSSFAKAVQAVEAADARADQAYEIAKALEERQEIGEYVELAKSYELPVNPDDLGPILYVIAKSGLSADQLDLVDRVFSAAGEAIYAETGFAGRGESPTMETIGSYAAELVGKADVSPEQATVAVLNANPAAYEDYLTENL